MQPTHSQLLLALADGGASAAPSVDSSGLSYARPRHTKSDESRLINKSSSWRLISSRSRDAQRAPAGKTGCDARNNSLMRSRASARLPFPCTCIHTTSFFFCPPPPQNIYARASADTVLSKPSSPARRLHTPAGAGPQKVVPVTRCTLCSGGERTGGGDGRTAGGRGGR